MIATGAGCPLPRSTAPDRTSNSVTTAVRRVLIEEAANVAILYSVHARGLGAFSRRNFLKTASLAAAASPFLDARSFARSGAETLYNGIRLGTPWPPNNRYFSTDPIEPPYLADPPENGAVSGAHVRLGMIYAKRGNREAARTASRASIRWRVRDARRQQVSAIFTFFELPQRLRMQRRRFTVYKA